MDLEKINEMWLRDSKIDEVLIDQASIRIPQLHQKYLTLHSEYVLLSKRKAQELDKVRHKRRLYYSGKALPKEYEKEPFEYHVMKADVPSWVSVDEQVQHVELKYEYYCVTIRVLEEILKQINQMSFNIKNVIEWRRFTGGV